MITDLVDNWRITVALRNPNDPKKIVKTKDGHHMLALT